MGDVLQAFEKDRSIEARNVDQDDGYNRHEYQAEVDEHISRNRADDENPRVSPVDTHDRTPCWKSDKRRVLQTSRLAICTTITAARNDA